MTEFVLVTREDYLKYESQYASWPPSQSQVNSRPFLVSAFDKIGDSVNRSKIMAALFDLHLTFQFVSLDAYAIMGNFNDYFASRLNLQSILENPTNFSGKHTILRYQTSLILRIRSFWDKYMGILILIYDYDNYEKFNSSRSRKKTFFDLSKQWPSISTHFQRPLLDMLQRLKNPDGFSDALENGYLKDSFLSVLRECIDLIDKEFRTAEAHSTGRMRKLTLSMTAIDMENGKFGDMRSLDFFQHTQRGMDGILGFYA